MAVTVDTQQNELIELISSSSSFENRNYVFMKLASEKY